MIFFTPEFARFFEELSENNHRDWFDANRERYENEVKKPFRALVEAVVQRLHDLEPNWVLDAGQCIFRINRDVRFSKDKRPYKEHVSAAFSKWGKKSAYPGYYFQLNHSKVMIGGGAYFLEKEHLEKVRQEIDYQMDEFDALVQSPVFLEHYGQILGERNKKAPLGYKDAFERQPLIANKEFYYMAELPASLVTSDALLDTVLEYFEAGKAFNHFFARAIEEGTA